MNSLAIFAIAVSLLFLFGCPGTEQPPAPIPQNVTQSPPAPPPVLHANNSSPQNGTLNNSSLAPGNDTFNESENGTGDGSENGTPEPPQFGDNVFTGIPRNVSDKIGEGQFDILDFPLEPLKVKVLNCGNADCVLASKGLFYMLIDAGSSQPVIDELERRGIDRLNVVVATRDDPIAIGGLAAIISTFQVDEFWYNGIDDGSANYKALLALVKEKGIAIKRPIAGDSMNVSGLRVAVLNPQKQKMLSNPDNDAVVLKLQNKNFCMDLLNPTVQERENAIISGSEPLSCQVVTYFRQGSGRPDPSMLMKFYAQPRDAIISVGAGIAGLPSQTTLTRLAGDGVKVWRTDTQGSISVASDVAGEYVITANSTN